MNFTLNLTLLASIIFGTQLCATEAQPPVHHAIVKLNFADCPRMKTLDTIIKTAPIVLFNLRNVARKAEATIELLDAQEAVTKTPATPELEQVMLQEHITTLLFGIKDLIEIVRKYDDLLRPIVAQVTGEKSLFIDLLSTKQDAAEFFYKHITSLKMLREICQELSVFAKSIYASLSNDTRESYKKLCHSSTKK